MTEMELWLTVSELSGNELSLFSDGRNHTCMGLILSSGQLDASIAWEVPCNGTGTLDCAFAGVYLTHLEPVTNMRWFPE
jgi:hypothetical protein